MTWRRRGGVAGLGLSILAMACGGEPPEAGAAEDATPGVVAGPVGLTWMSVTNWLIEAGPTTVVLDGYVSRVDRTTVGEDGTSTGPSVPDSAAVARVREAVLPAGGPDWVLVGHGHWDHAWDAATWARSDGGRVVGARTVCYQARALGLPEDRCRAVEGGESFELGPGVRVRVVRWHHSGDSTSLGGRRLRASLELAGVPELRDGGLRPGFLEDFPSGGGARAYLITVDTDRGPVRIFWSNTGNPELWDVPIPADSAFFRENGLPTEGLEWSTSDVPVRAALADAVSAEGADSVDVWLGFGSTPHVRQVLEVLRPAAFVPHHWDDFWGPLEDGVAGPYPGRSLAPFLEEEGVRFVSPTQYFDRFRLTPSGLEPAGDAGVRARLGIPEAPGG